MKAIDETVGIRREAGKVRMFCPKITMITVTLNSDKTLERTIKSVIKQKYDNLEYLIIDGGSTDHTIDIIRKYERYITHWVSEPDKGISDAFNKGIKMSTGEIIGIINSDDGLCAGALQTLAEEYEEDIDIYRGKIILWNTETGTKVIEKPSMHFPMVDINPHVSHQGTFVTKRAYDKYGLFDTDIKYAMDYDLLIRFEKMNVKMKYINHVMAYFTLGGVTYQPYSAERLRETDKIFKAYGATVWQRGLTVVFRGIKIAVKKIIPKDALLKMKYKKIGIADVESLGVAEDRN